MPYQPGQILLNTYRLQRRLDAGRMQGVQVFSAERLQGGELHALKILRRDAPGLDPKEFELAAAQLQREAELGKHLQHPNLLRVYGLAQWQGDLVLAMDYAPQGSLSDLLERAGQSRQLLPIPAVLRLARDIAGGLSALHNISLVHRDLKPSNILLDASGWALVADLGLVQIPHGPSRRSQYSDPPPHPGTPGYMSPEQEQTRGYLTPASDIYSVGLILFEMLTGRVYCTVRPGTRPASLRADLPAWLDELLPHMLADEPANRPWDGSELLKLLQEQSSGVHPIPVADAVAAAAATTGSAAAATMPPPIPTGAASELAASAPTSAAPESAATTPVLAGPVAAGATAAGAASAPSGAGRSAKPSPPARPAARPQSRLFPAAVALLLLAACLATLGTAWLFTQTDLPAILGLVISTPASAMPSSTASHTPTASATMTPTPTLTPLSIPGLQPPGPGDTPAPEGLSPTPTPGAGTPTVTRTPVATGMLTPTPSPTPSPSPTATPSLLEKLREKIKDFLREPPRKG